MRLPRLQRLSVSVYGHRLPRLALGQALAVALLLALLVTGLGPSTGVHADGPFATCGPYPQYPQPCPPADVLNYAKLAGPFFVGQNQPLQATPAQTASLNAFVAQAITNTLSDFGLPSTDAAAVQTWGRPELLGELWGLITNAISTTLDISGTPGITPTADQQNVYDWMSHVFQLKEHQIAQEAGRQFVKWAGLDEAAFQNLLDTGATTDTLTSFLSQTPINFNNTDPSKADGGFCAYTPPAPDQNDYTRYAYQECFTPCTTICASPIPPDTDHLLKWAKDQLDYPLTSNADYIANASDVAIGVAAGGAAAVGIPALSALGFAAWYHSASSAGSATGLASTIGKNLFPYTQRAALVTRAAVQDGVQVAEQVEEDVEAGTVTAEEIATAALEALATFTRFFPPLAVIGAIAATGYYIYQLVGTQSEEENLASAIEATIAKPLNAALTDPAQGQELFDDFLQVTLPSPRWATCDNSLQLVGANGVLSPQCMNAPAIPDPAPTDPLFVITPQGATAPLTSSSTLSWLDGAALGITNTARVSGNWFIDTQTDITGTNTYQQLKIHYTDWDGNGQVAYLVHDPTTGRYKFLTLKVSSPSFNASTCLADNTCGYADSIDYIGTDNRHYSARLGTVGPTVAPTFSANPVEGSPVTFTANSSSSFGLAVTNHWQFSLSQTGSGTFCYPDGPTCVQGIPVTAPVIGGQVSYTFPAGGTFSVVLTAVDSAGQSTVKIFKITVASKTHSPAMVTIAGVAPLSGPSCSPCDKHSVLLGSLTTIDGAITHTVVYPAAETLSIDWGDNSPNWSLIFGLLPPGYTGTDPFSFSHTYAAPGRYTVHLLDNNPFGGASIVTTETVQVTPTLSWSAASPITYGDTLTLDPLNIVASAPGVSGTVPGRILTESANKYGVPFVFGAPFVPPAGQYPLSEFFYPSDPTLYTRPTGPATGSVTVNPAPLTITANDQSMPVGGVVPAFDARYDGLVNGDQPGVVGGVTCGALDAEGNPVSSSTPPGRYPITCSGGAADNYAITYVPGTLTIEAPSPTPSDTSTATNTPTVTPTASNTPTASDTPTASHTPTATKSPTPTDTPTATTTNAAIPTAQAPTATASAATPPTSTAGNTTAPTSLPTATAFPMGTPTVPPTSSPTARVAGAKGPHKSSHLALSVTFSPTLLVSGNWLTASVKTEKGARITVTVLVTRRQTVKTTLKHVKRTVIRETTLYKRILNGIADGKGRARLRLHLTYRPSGSVPLQVKVAVSVGSRHAGMTRTLRLRPAAHKPRR